MELNPRVDFAFKKLFGSEENKDLLIALINAVVSEQDQVRDIELKNPYSFKDFAQDKMTVMDIKAIDHRGHHYNIEIQITDQPFYNNRMLYYWSKMYGSQLKAGESFDFLKKTIGIHILNFNMLEEDRYHNVFKILNVSHLLELRETGPLIEEGHNPFFSHLELHTIELEKFDTDLAQLKTSLDRWVTFLKKADDYGKNKIPQELGIEKPIEKAITTLERMYVDEDERMLYEGQLKWYRDQILVIKTHELEARAEGHAEGLALGLEAGRVEEKRQIAQKLKAAGLSLDEIATVTGLSVDLI